MEHQIGNAGGVDLANRTLGDSLFEYDAQEFDDAILLVAGIDTGHAFEAHFGIARERHAKDVIAGIGRARDLDDATNLATGRRFGLDRRGRISNEGLGILVEKTSIEIFQ